MRSLFPIIKNTLSFRNEAKLNKVKSGEMRNLYLHFAIHLFIMLKIVKRINLRRPLNTFNGMEYLPLNRCLSL
jgi:hypothetical protein